MTLIRQNLIADISEVDSQTIGGHTCTACGVTHDKHFLFCPHCDTKATQSVKEVSRARGSTPMMVARAKLATDQVEIAHKKANESGVLMKWSQRGFRSKEGDQRQQMIRQHKKAIKFKCVEIYDRWTKYVFSRICERTWF